MQISPLWVVSCLLAASSQFAHKSLSELRPSLAVFSTVNYSKLPIYTHSKLSLILDRLTIYTRCRRRSPRRQKRQISSQPSSTHTDFSPPLPTIIPAQPAPDDCRPKYGRKMFTGGLIPSMSFQPTACRLRHSTGASGPSPSRCTPFCAIKPLKNGPSKPATASIRQSDIRSRPASSGQTRRQGTSCAASSVSFSALDDPSDPSAKSSSSGPPRSDIESSYCKRGAIHLEYGTSCAPGRHGFARAVAVQSYSGCCGTPQ